MNRNEFWDLLNLNDLPVSSRMLDQFDQFKQRLLASNQKVNLISSNDEVKIYKRHFLDSVGILKVTRIPEGSHIVDLGSGAGFPGVPLKIIRPDLSMDLVESRLKRALFLENVVNQLELKRVRVFGKRMEELKIELSGAGFVVSRAVSSLVNLCKWSSPVLKGSGGKLLILKGRELDEELKRLDRKRSTYGVSLIEVQDYRPFPSIASSFDRKFVIISFKKH